ncbi:MAG: hypothetical protein ACJZ7A_03670 [Opitutales bacterium]
MSGDKDYRESKVGGKTFKVFNLRRHRGSGGGGFNFPKMAKLASIGVPVLAVALLMNRGGMGTGYDGIEYGGWSDADLMRGGESESNQSTLPEWVEPVSYEDKSQRGSWLESESSGERKIKVWLDEDKGVFMIHRPGDDEPESVPLGADRSTREQLLELLDRLKEEIDP